MSESKEQLKSLLMKVKEGSEKADSALTLRVNLIPLPNFVDNWNPKILDLADKCVHCISAAQWYPTLCDPMDYSTHPGLPVHHQLPELTQTHVIRSVMPSNHLILCCPLLLLSLIFPSIRVFSNESALRIRWPQ